LISILILFLRLDLKKYRGTQWRQNVYIFAKPYSISQGLNSKLVLYHPYEVNIFSLFRLKNFWESQLSQNTYRFAESSRILERNDSKLFIQSVYNHCKVKMAEND